MNNLSPQLYSVLSPRLGMFVTGLLFVYCLCYHPFVTEAFLFVPIRIGIEASILLILTSISLRQQNTKEILQFLIVIYVFICVVALGANSAGQLISSFNKLAFLMLTIGLLYRDRVILNTCIRLWIALAYLFSTMAIAAFVGHATGIISFTPMDLGEVTAGVQGSYYYLHNALLGNLIPRRLFGIEFGRVAGFMFEGALLACFFSFNILVARDWIGDAKKMNRFVLLNVVAGITTLSTTFVLFFMAYFFIRWIYGTKKNEFEIRMIVVLFLGAILGLIVLGSNYAGQTSGTDRLDRMLMYIDVIENSTWLSLLFGSGVGVAQKAFGIGIDAGWIAVLIERGAIMLVFLAYLYVRYTKHNPWLMIYFFYSNMAMNLFWDPIFLLGIAMQYAFYRGQPCRVAPVLHSGTVAGIKSESAYAANTVNAVLGRN